MHLVPSAHEVIGESQMHDGSNVGKSIQCLDFSAPSWSFRMALEPGFSALSPQQEQHAVSGNLFYTGNHIVSSVNVTHSKNLPQLMGLVEFNVLFPDPWASPCDIGFCQRFVVTTGDKHFFMG